MLRLHQLVLKLDEAKDFDVGHLRRLCAQRLKVKETDIQEVKLKKRSVDARGREGAHFTLTADVLLRDAKAEGRIAQKFKPNQVVFLS